MRCDYACGSFDHLQARRKFMGSLASGATLGGLGVLTRPLSAEQLKRKQKHVLVFNMAGGLLGSRRRRMLHFRQNPKRLRR